MTTEERWGWLERQIEDINKKLDGIDGRTRETELACNSHDLHIKVIVKLLGGAWAVIVGVGLVWLGVWLRGHG
jgi:hypothetical protein